MQFVMLRLLFVIHVFYRITHVSQCIIYTSCSASCMSCTASSMSCTTSCMSCTASCMSCTASCMSCTASCMPCNASCIHNAFIAVAGYNACGPVCGRLFGPLYPGQVSYFGHQREANKWNLLIGNSAPRTRIDEAQYRAVIRVYRGDDTKVFGDDRYSGARGYGEHNAL